MAQQAQATGTLAMPQWRPYVMLVVGVLAASTAAILIRLGQDDGAPSLVLAAGRLCVASAVLTPFVWRHHRQELRAVARRDLLWMGLSGVVLGLHFATWISSLEYTAVVNSVTLVTTSPLWVALAAPLFLNEKMHRWTLIGLLLALGGGVLVGLTGSVGDPPTRHDPLLGNGLALVGAVMVAIYFMIGRLTRARLGVMVYIWLVYTVAAVTLVIGVVLAGESLRGLPWTAFLWIALLGLIPQLLGHSSFNYALGYLPAAYVSMVVLAEPVVSGTLAMLLLGENPVPLQIAGSALILVGIAVATHEQDLEKSAPVD